MTDSPTPRQAHLLSTLTPAQVADLSSLTDEQLRVVRDNGHAASRLLLARAFKLVQEP